MRREIIILFGLMAISVHAHAQYIGTIKGKVIDARTKEPLVGTNVIVLDTKRGASSDVNREFDLS